VNRLSTRGKGKEHNRERAKKTNGENERRDGEGVSHPPSLAQFPLALPAAYPLPDPVHGLAINPQPK